MKKLSYTEQQKLQMLLDLLNMNQLEKRAISIDALNRSRDDLGCFKKENEHQEVELKSRLVKAVKVKGTYGTYIIKSKWYENDDIIYFGVGVGLAAMTIHQILSNI